MLKLITKINKRECESSKGLLYTSTSNPLIGDSILGGKPDASAPCCPDNTLAMSPSAAMPSSPPSVKGVAADA